MRLRNLGVILASGFLFVSCLKPVCTVSFDLNYPGATGAPASQTVARGASAQRPSDPVRAGWSFRGWYEEAACLRGWDFGADPVLGDITLWAGWKELGPPAPGQVSSIEFGHQEGRPDYCAPMAIPGGFGNGWLFSVWTKIPDDLSDPVLNALNRGNMIVVELSGSNWNLICLVGNIYVFGNGLAAYNANYMLGVGDLWAGDYCTYQTLEYQAMPISTVSDWVWVAWQVILNPDGSFTFRQWLKFGIDGDVFPAGHWHDSVEGVEIVGLQYIRDFVTDTTYEGPEEHNWGMAPPYNGGRTMDAAAAAAWTPGPFASFRLGWDNSASGVGDDGRSYLCHARMEARTTAPTLEELNALARASAPDGTAWGDWELVWRDGMPDISDRSGHGRDLSVASGGALYEGVLSPVFP